MIYVICTGCGKVMSGENIKGSLKHPYCEPCFEREFNNDYEKYEKFLEERHMLLPLKETLELFFVRAIAIIGLIILAPIWIPAWILGWCVQLFNEWRERKNKP